MGVDHISNEDVERFLMGKCSVREGKDIVAASYLVPGVNERILDVIRSAQDECDQTILGMDYKEMRELFKPLSIRLREENQEGERFRAYLDTLSPEEKERAIGKMV